MEVPFNWDSCVDNLYSKLLHHKTMALAYSIYRHSLSSESFHTNISRKQVTNWYTRAWNGLVNCSTKMFGQSIVYTGFCTTFGVSLVVQGTSVQELYP